MIHLKSLAKQLTVMVLLINISSHAYGKPWLEAGDMLLRHQLQLLADNDLLDAPISSWPLSSRDVFVHLNDSNKKNHRALIDLAKTINIINLKLKQEDYGAHYNVGFSANTQTLLIRDFSAKGRDKSSASYDAEWGTSFIDVRLKATVSEKSTHPDDTHTRLDESYVSTSIRNWRFSVGKQSRWWGPGWDGSLILSNNARPFPSLSLDREESKPFNNKLLHWIGPWKLSMFAGQLEASRKIPNVKVLGARFNFKPTPNFEVGLSRVAQWGGQGRVQSMSTLLNSIAGIDNVGGAEEPGNQLAGFDARWRSPIGNNKPYAIYGQMIGEDEAKYLPYQYTALFGLETWGKSQSLDGTWRVYLEASDTSADALQNRPRNNVAYNHHIYTDGYRFLDTSLGHGIDSDSKIVGIGALLAQNNGNFWRAWVKDAKLNMDGVGKNPLAPNGRHWKGIGLSLDKNINKQTKVNLGVQYVVDQPVGGETKKDLGFSVGVIHTF